MLATDPLARQLGLSPKQAEFFYADRFMNIAEGAVRGGKTYSGQWRFAMHAKTAPPGDMMVIGKTERTAKRNFISPLQQMLGKRVRYVQGAGELYIGDRLIHVAGANDVRAHEKIQGSTLVGAYCNEVTLFPEDVFQTLIDRLSLPGAKLFADCNPNSPYHWLYVNYLTNEKALETDVHRISFQLDDNPTLGEDYKARLKRLHSGLWYRRMVLGHWVVAEGAVYPMFDTTIHVVDEMPASPSRIIVGVDYGTSTVTAFLAAGLVGDTWYIFKEYYHDAEADRQKTPDEHANDFVEFLGAMKPEAIEVDPSAAVFKLALRRRGIKRVNDADNAVVDGIQDVSRALSNGKLKILKHCMKLQEEKSNYVWDPKAQEKGEDKPIKHKDHLVDTERYICRRAFGPPKQRSLKLVR